jgi:hypothetical protein
MLKVARGQSVARVLVGATVVADLAATLVGALLAWFRPALLEGAIGLAIWLVFAGTILIWLVGGAVFLLCRCTGRLRGGPGRGRGGS